MSENLTKIQYFEAILKGFSQIVLQENSKAGMLILAGLTLSSWEYGYAGLFASILSVVFARLLNFDKENIKSGLYGFNSILLAVGLVYFYGLNNIVILFILLSSFLSTILQNIFILKKYPTFTLPFILVLWLLNFIIYKSKLLAINGATTNDIININNDYIKSILLSYGQIFFQTNILASVLFIVSIGISSIKKLILTIITSILCLVLAIVFHNNINEMGLGLFGYNAILTILAIYPIVKNSIIYLLLGIIGTYFVQTLLMQIELLNTLGGILTLPFVLGTWLVLILKKFIN